jgi:ABC-type transport system substrate-binding protein
MTVKRVLILAPAVLILFLLQSYFWVPTYEQQTRGNPQRLKEFITASIGDASLLNPILTADSASSQIESLVFEGLIDRDEELRFRGRLATSWEVHEEAFFYVNSQAVVPGLGKAGANDVADLLVASRNSGTIRDEGLAASMRRIRDVKVIPAREFRMQERIETAGDETERTVTVMAPPRIKLVLSEVDPDLFENLAVLLGGKYFAGFSAESCIRVQPPVDDPTLKRLARRFLPATEHNPVIVFHLRKGVKFHDGETFDAEDVKFTFDAIMNPEK